MPIKTQKTTPSPWPFPAVLCHIAANTPIIAPVPIFEPNEIDKAFCVFFSVQQLLVFVLNFLFMSSFSQNDSINSYLLNKRGQRVIPEEGSIAGGIDVLPFLNYLGNFSNNTQKYWLWPCSSKSEKLPFSEAKIPNIIKLRESIGIYESNFYQKKVRDYWVLKNENIY